ncbi:MAG: GtrA family protein [Pseudomonadota bacterium]
MSGWSLAFRYTAFAVVAVLVNLATQRVVLAMGWQSEGIALALAIAAGTITGLLVKYVLDKRWIFYDDTAGAQAQSKQFALYSAMGLVTTAIFWGTETLFWAIWRTDVMRELGAVIGLTIGYVTKYQLDKRFVFAPRAVS